MAKQPRTTTYFSPLSGKTVYLAGAMQKWWSPTRFPQFLKEERASFTRRLDATVDVFILGDQGNTAAAENKAKLLQSKGAALRIVSADEFVEMLLPPQEQLLAWLRGGPDGIKQWNRLAINPAFHKHLVMLRDLDLRKTDLGDLHFSDFSNQDFALQGADLRGANLRGASLSLEDCKLEGANLDGAHLHKIERCSFVGVNMSQIGGSGEVILQDCDLSRADLHGVNLRQFQIESCRLDKADLRDVVATYIPARPASFVGANLQGAIFSEADLQQANFCRANLRQANFADADLTGAQFDGADLTDTNLVGATLKDVDLSKAKGTPRLTSDGAVGKWCKELIKLSKKGNCFLETTAMIQCHDRSIQLQFQTSTFFLKDSQGGGWSDFEYRKLEHAMEKLIHKWSGATLDVALITVRAVRAPLKKNALLEMVRGVWCELLGVAPPSSEQVKLSQKTVQETLADEWQTWLATLRRGKDGIKQWNAHAVKLNKQFATLSPGVDLSGCHLEGWAAHDMNLQQANLRGANLQESELFNCAAQQADFSQAQLDNAKLSRGDFSGGNFAEASMQKVEFIWANMQGTNLRGANLTDANCYGTDLRGTDLTDAILTDTWLGNAKYDEATKLPQGFVPPKGMNWKGSKPAPSAKPKQSLAKPKGKLSFDAFMERLQSSVEPAKLDKALTMLKAEKFKLYADVQADHLIGVVKSQRDANTVYSCRLDSQGNYACCTQDLHTCGGLKGSICKHLLVLIVGLTKSGDANPNALDQWVQASRNKKQAIDKDVMSETFLKYKGAEAGEVDWRPTETIPEDYYAV